jgi:UrcA family protein
MLLLLAALAVSPVSALTMTSLDEPTVTVSARDLDMIDPMQVRRLEMRIASAVKSVCRSHDVRGAAEQARYAQCRAVAIAGARVQTDRIIAAARQPSSVTLARK